MIDLNAKFETYLLWGGLQEPANWLHGNEGGYYENDFTWGATLKLSNFQMDYGLAKDRIGLGDTHHFSLLNFFLRTTPLTAFKSLMLAMDLSPICLPIR